MTMGVQPLQVAALNLIHAAARGPEDTVKALLQGHGGLLRNDFDDADLSTWIGRVDGVESERIAEPLSKVDCRNNRLAQMALDDAAPRAALREAIRRFGADRIGVFLGTGTSGIHTTELACREGRGAMDFQLPASFSYRYTHDTYSCAAFIRRLVGLLGPAVVISTACSSSAKVFPLAERYIRAGLCDAALVGGVDSLCLTILYGFNSLELLSSEPCRPWDAHRSGISIGEGAGFALLVPGRTGVALVGYGESSDAYHIATPHSQGEGAARAMREALSWGAIPSEAVDYIDLHGTATRSNDAAEDQAVSSVFGPATPCSSTKGWTGHTLGAAGITEALLSVLAITHGIMPGSLNTRTLDPARCSRGLGRAAHRLLDELALCSGASSAPRRASERYPCDRIRGTGNGPARGLVSAQPLGRQTGLSGRSARRRACGPILGRGCRQDRD